MMIRLNRGEIDIDTFNWPYRDRWSTGVYPPLVTEINDTFYLLSRFDGPPADDTYLLHETDSFSKALTASIDSYGVNTVNLVEAANIARICGNLGIDIDSVRVFDVLRIKNRKYFEALHAVLKFPDGLKSYIASPGFQPRILTVIAELPERLYPVIEGFVTNEHPKPESFIRFVHLVSDFAEAIDCSCYDPAAISRATGADARRIALLERLGDLATAMAPASVEPDTDLTGSAALRISFSIESPADYDRIIAELGEKRDAVTKIYDIINARDELSEK